MWDDPRAPDFDPLKPLRDAANALLVMGGGGLFITCLAILFFWVALRSGGPNG